MLFSLAVFCLVSFALGLAVYGKLKSYGKFEALIMSSIFGVCIYPIVGIILSGFNAVNIYIVFSLSLVVVGYYLARYKINYMKPTKHELFAIIFAILLFIVFCYGGFSMPWLEDGDPNGHAVVASYIAHYHTYSKPADMFIARYMEPYPVGFQIWIGTLAQDGLDIVGTLKLYNYLFISLGIIAFFFLVKTLSNDERLASFSTFILAILPTFSTRFIFSQAFATTQVIVILYFISLAIKKSNKFYMYGGVILGSLFLTHPTTSAVMGGFIVIWMLFDWFINAKLNVGFIVLIVCGCLIGGSWWLSEFQKYGISNVKEQLNLNVLGKGLGFTDPTMRYYSIKDFIDSPIDNSIDNMTGVGLFAFVLACLGCIKFIVERKEYQILILLWLCFCILGVYSNYLPISLIPSRFWVYMSIPFSVIAGFGLMSLFPKSLATKNPGGNISPKLSKKVEDRVEISIFNIVSFIAIVGLMLTSAYPKIILNSQPWGSARFFTQGDYNTLAYAMAKIPVGSKAMDACMYERVWSMNLWDDPLDKEAIIFKNNNVNTSKYGWDSEGWLKLKSMNDSNIFNENVTQIHYFLKSKEYKYLFINTRCITNGIKNYDYENRIKELDSNPLFNVFYQYDLERIYEVK